MLGALREEGYDLGPSSDPVDGEAIVAALTAQVWSPPPLASCAFTARLACSAPGRRHHLGAATALTVHSVLSLTSRAREKRLRQKTKCNDAGHRHGCVVQESQRAVSRGVAGIESLGSGEAAHFGAVPAASAVSPRDLRSALTYPSDWGSTEWVRLARVVCAPSCGLPIVCSLILRQLVGWLVMTGLQLRGQARDRRWRWWGGQGPIPFLPDPDILVRRMEKTWGDLDRYRGIQSTAKGGRWPRPPAPSCRPCILCLLPATRTPH